MSREVEAWRQLVEIERRLGRVEGWLAAQGYWPFEAPISGSVDAGSGDGEASRPETRVERLVRLRASAGLPDEVQPGEELEIQGAWMDDGIR